MTQLDVSIMGQPYKLACKEGEEGALQQAVEQSKSGRLGRYRASRARSCGLSHLPPSRRWTVAHASLRTYRPND